MELIGKNGRVIQYGINSVTGDHVIVVPGEGQVSLSDEELCLILDQVGQKVLENASEVEKTHTNKKGKN